MSDSDGIASVIIVGAGASGVLAAAHLRRHMPDAIVVLISAADGGVGLAYGRAEPGHLLNVPAAFMSAFPDAPGDFVVFARAEPGMAHIDGQAFAPRRVFGAYLRRILDRAGARVVSGEAAGLHHDGAHWHARLTDGRSIAGHAVILAAGNPPPVVPPPLRPLAPPVLAADPWDPARFDGIAADGTIVLVGTGLTMVDQVVSLRSRGHRGPITALSRRGQVPHAHLTAPSEPWPVPQALPATALGLMRAVRGAAAAHPWRGVVDGLRPHTIPLWQALPMSERARLLRHARAYWDVRRSRIAPEVAEVVAEIRRSGQLSVLAGRVGEVTRAGERAHVRIRGRSGEHAITADRVIVCTGPGRQTGGGLLRVLKDAGFVRDDALGLGLDATPDGNVLDRTGRVATSLFALGPPLRGILWESIAVPDIARQAAALAAHVAAGLRARAPVTPGRTL